MTISNIANNKNAYSGLNMNSFLNSDIKKQPQSQTLSKQQSDKVKYAFTLRENISDYTFIIDNKNDLLYIGLRSNNGFGSDKTEYFKYTLSDYDRISFPSGDSPDINFSDYKNEENPISLSFTEEGFAKKNLYRSGAGRKDIVRAGGNSDQFRASKTLDGDVFFGGGGNDTLYLQGGKDTYTYEYVDLEGYGQLLKITDKANPTNFMYISTDVERVRFVKGSSNNTGGLTPKQRKAEVFKIADLIPDNKDPYYISSNPTIQEVFGSQSNDRFFWGAEYDATIRGRAGSDTIDLREISERYNLNFEFKYDKNNKFEYLEIAYGSVFSDLRTLKCYDFENITLYKNKTKDGKTLTLDELKSKLVNGRLPYDLTV